MWRLYSRPEWLGVWRMWRARVGGNDISASRTGYWPAVGLLATIAAPAVLWLQTLAALARGWQPPSWHLLPRVFLVPILLLGVATVGPCAAFLWRGGREFYRRNASHLALAFVVLVASTLTAEIMANLTFDRWTAYHRRPPNVDVVFHSRPELFPGMRGDAHYRTNSLGIRA